jgi:hypothetical protein
VICHGRQAHVIAVLSIENGITRNFVLSAAVQDFPQGKS